MKLISCHDGKLLTLNAGVSAADGAPSGAGEQAFRTGLAALDVLPPGGAFARGAVHELIFAPGDGPPAFFAAWLARCAGDKKMGDKENALASPVPLPPCPPVSLSSFPAAVVWSDPARELYPPAVAALGIPLERLLLLHPADEAEQLWAAAECLRCRGVAAVVAALPERRRRLSKVDARRLQLAAEQGGGVGLILRTVGRTSAAPPEHAAVTRWFVRPERGERNVQRWRIQLIYGHGGRVGESVILEHRRDHPPQSVPAPRVAARPVRPAAELADRPAVPPASRATG